MSCCRYIKTHGVHGHNCYTVTEALCACGARMERLHKIKCVQYEEPCKPLDTKAHPGCKFQYLYSEVAGLYDSQGLKLDKMLRGIIQWQDYVSSDREVWKAKTWEYPKLLLGGALRIGEYVFFALLDSTVFYEVYDAKDLNHSDLQDQGAIGDWVEDAEQKKSVAKSTSTRRGRARARAKAKKAAKKAALAKAYLQK
jgi:hypothetical protein